MRVLITSAGNKVNLVKEFQKWGAIVVSDDLNPGSKACLVADEFYCGQDVDLVINTRDADIKHPICWDKLQFNQFCRRHGFSIPLTGICDLNEKLVLKKRNGSGGKEVTIVDRSYLMQEFVDWPEYSIDYFADYEGVPLSCIPRKRLEVVNGESTKAEIVFNEKLILEGLRMGKELNIKGPATMQCFFNGERIKWIEVNPRFGGGSHLTWHIFSGPRWYCEEFKMRDSNVSVTQNPPMR